LSSFFHGKGSPILGIEGLLTRTRSDARRSGHGMVRGRQTLRCGRSPRSSTTTATTTTTRPWWRRRLGGPGPRHGPRRRRWWWSLGRCPVATMLRGGRSRDGRTRRCLGETIASSGGGHSGRQHGRRRHGSLDGAAGAHDRNSSGSSRTQFGRVLDTAFSCKFFETSRGSFSFILAVVVAGNDRSRRVWLEGTSNGRRTQNAFHQALCKAAILNVTVQGTRRRRRIGSRLFQRGMTPIIVAVVLILAGRVFVFVSSYCHRWRWCYKRNVLFFFFIVRA